VKVERERRLAKGRFSWGGLVWETQPKWAKIVQAMLIFPVLGVMLYVLFFDPDDSRGLFGICVFALIPIACLQMFFFLKASTEDVW